MLEAVDRIQLVVTDRAATVEIWRALFDAEVVGEDESAVLGAKRTTVRAGVSEIEFLEPSAPGRISRFSAAWRQGLYGAGFSTPDLGAMARHLEREGVSWREEGGRLYLSEESTHGMPTVLTQRTIHQAAGNVLAHIYEVTNPVTNAKTTTAHYARIFGLAAARFSPIASKLYGYEGTLTLFDPPARLDRVEVTQTHGGGAMDRFFQRRGASLYMCYAETDDVPTLAARLRARGARFTDSEDRPPETGLFIHPSALDGMLMGISRTSYAWDWSGRPELAGAGAESYRAH